MFTYQYAQPSEYRFSLDTIELARFVAKLLLDRDDLADLRVLDLCAGCGVMGLELSYHVRALRHIDFVEIQDIYTEYFDQNVAIVNRPELQLAWHLVNYDVLLTKEWEAKYDLIISNPPYFQPEQGMLSPSQFKNRCRFFIDSSFANFLHAMVNALKPGGQAYFLLRSRAMHGQDVISEVKSLLQDHEVRVETVTQVRGTDVVCIEKTESHYQ